MTIEEIAVQAIARAGEFSNSVPGARSLIYRRIGIRQQQLFTRAARLNPDFYGVCATGVLNAGVVDLADLVAPVEAADSVMRVEIADKGTSAYASGDEVNIVPVTDTDIDDAPRATLRNRVIRGVGSDLDLVVSLKVHYSRLPAAVVPTDGARDADIEEPHVELLVVDAAKYLVNKATSMAEVAQKAALAALDREEAMLLDAYDGHVMEYVGSGRARFGAPPFQAPTENTAAK